MKLEPTGFSGLFVLEPKVFRDNRGYFVESYNYRSMQALGVDLTFKQDNQSYSTYGVLRGLHFQNLPYAQTKLIRVLHGNILDVVVDLRKSEPTFGKHFALELSEENQRQLFIPKGFAHGFAVLSKSAMVLYKCDEYYHPQFEAGIRFDDPALGIDWKIKTSDRILSSKDLQLPLMADAIFSF